MVQFTDIISISIAEVSVETDFLKQGELKENIVWKQSSNSLWRKVYSASKTWIKVFLHNKNKWLV